MPQLQPETLTTFIADIFQAAGAPTDQASVVAQSLVSANLTGHDSHGVIRTIQYLNVIEQGTLIPTAVPTIADQLGAITKIDAQHSFGQTAAKFAMEVSIAKAQQHGLAATALLNANHIGRVGEWVKMAADANMIGLAFCNGGSPGGLVAPHGGSERKLGTNPFAAAVPLNGRSPFVLDFATSVFAEGKVRVARNKGVDLPAGIILDKAGQPSTNPHDLYDQGMLLPAGLYKGFGLSLLIEMLGGLLTGMGSPALPSYTLFRNGVVFLVLAIEPFRPLADFLLEAGQLADAVKSTKPAAGTTAVLLPGEPEEETAVRRRAEGIPLDETTWAQLTAVAAKWGVTAPTISG